MSTSKTSRSPVSHGRLNLEQQRKRAKELLKALNAGNPSALQRVSLHLPARSQALRLADAQLVIAREAGFASWPRLKSHIDSLEHAGRRMLRDGDQDLRTLHIRCGSDIQHNLKTAGFSGDFLEFSDPFCIGPLSASEPETLLRQRAVFLAETFDLTLADALARQQQSYRRLQQLDDYQRFVLWFEHDSYDQLILAYLLQRLQQLRPSAQIELIAVDQIPGVQRFIGIGQLAPDVLSWLWPRRQPVSEALLELGSQAWQALTEQSPEALLQLIKNGTPALPMLGKALHRHLQQLPDEQHGLGLTEYLSLQILQQQGPLTAGQVFRELMLHQEPLPYLGDLMFWWLLQPLLSGATPLLQIDDPAPAWPQRLIRLTAQGEAVLAAKADGFAARGTPYWVGGVQLIPGAAHWRYDAERQQLHYHSA
ncbi:protein of unknown function [Halopseudomonas sabulinigri]|uniref:DUF1835 domain-containing protein n=1 Tax=Halopseudomonas sabulinigri TaxID=472181 RepID=A0A1H1QDJ2_9GAMM|nr:DUF1835 domain-containing protein [Halopseudomonas sabulinigri]SDS21506.1 protein of unknown function [Halopseudomonas sabulinigri]